jgi:hypothetical protein
MPVCLSCLGQRKIQGMGFMGEVDCRTCKGTGLAEAKVGSVQSIEIIGLSETWSPDALTTKGGGIGKIETLELEIEEEIQEKTLEAELAKIKPRETITGKFKRKYTKPSK